MRSDSVYPYYILYLNYRLNEGAIGSGAYRLLRLSRSAFDNFKYRFEKDELFHNRHIELYISEERDKKINDIFSGEDKRIG
jgi:hypothetical protein